MAQQRRSASIEPPAVTVERAARLCRLARLLAAGGMTRAKLLQRLKIDLRGFYRDMQMLRAAGVEVQSKAGHYALGSTEKEAIALLPCPDPHLTLGEVAELSKGRGGARRKLQELVKGIVTG